MEVAGKGEGGDKSQLIKAISAEQGLVQNLNQPIIQPRRKRECFCVCVVAVISAVDGWLYHLLL